MCLAGCDDDNVSIGGSPCTDRCAEYERVLEDGEPSIDALARQVQLRQTRLEQAAHLVVDSGITWQS